MSSGLIKEIRHLAKVAIPIIDHLDLLTPTADALIDGASGTERIWKMWGDDCTFVGQKINQPQDRIIVRARRHGNSYVESTQAIPNHELWFIRTHDQPSSVRHLSGNMTELSVRATVRDLHLTLEKLPQNRSL